MKFCTQGIIYLRCFVTRQFLSRIYALSSVKFSGLKCGCEKKMTNHKYKVRIFELDAIIVEQFQQFATKSKTENWQIYSLWNWRRELGKLESFDKIRKSCDFGGSLLNWRRRAPQAGAAKVSLSSLYSLPQNKNKKKKKKWNKKERKKKNKNKNEK